MMCRIKNFVEATQITKEMFEGKQEPPKRCYRFCSSRYGTEMSGSAVISFDGVRRLDIGDWIVEGLFETVILSDKDFNKFLEAV